MKETIQMIMYVFTKQLYAADLGLAITTEGDFIFNDRLTGKKMAIKKQDFINAYNSLENSREEVKL